MLAMESFAESLQRLWDPVATPAGAVLAALASHLWRRFRHRMILLRCQIVHTPAANSAGLGAEFEVKYGGQSAPNLFLCSVTIQNDSSKDLAGVVVNLAYKDGTIFLTGGGSIIGSTKFLPLTAEYLEQFARALALPTQEEQSSATLVLNTRRDYLLPVFNRGARAQFAFTVHGVSSATPNLSVGCDHVGVRFVLQPPRQLFWGEPNARAAFTGLAAGIGLLLLLPHVVGSSWSVSWWMFFIGATTIVIGALLLKGWRLLTRVLS